MAVQSDTGPRRSSRKEHVMETDLLKIPNSNESGHGLFQTNLEAFKEHAPYLHKRLIAIDTLFGNADHHLARFGRVRRGGERDGA